MGKMGEMWITENAEFLPSDIDGQVAVGAANPGATGGMTPKQMRQAMQQQKKAMQQRTQMTKQYMKLYNQQAKQVAKLTSKFPQFMQPTQQFPYGGVPVNQPQQQQNPFPYGMAPSPYNQPYAVPPQYYQNIQPYAQPQNQYIPAGAPASMYHDAYAATGQMSAPLWSEVPAGEYELYDETTPVGDMVFSQGLLGLGATVEAPAWANTFEAVTNKLVDTAANVYQRVNQIKDARKGVQNQAKIPLQLPYDSGFLGLSQGTWAAIGMGALALGAGWAITRKKGKR